MPRISRGCAVSNRSLSATSSSADRRVCMRGRPWVRVGVWHRESTEDPFRMLKRPDPYRKAASDHVRHRPDRPARRNPREPARRPARTPKASRAEAANLPKLAVSDRELADLEMIAVGALSPAHGLPGRGRLPLGPGLDAPDERPAVVDPGHALASTTTARTGSAAPPPWRSRAGEGGEPLAILRISEIYARDKAKEAVSVYRTDDPAHPGVARRQRRRATSASRASSR